MSVLTQIFPKMTVRHGEKHETSAGISWTKKISEAFWFTTALGLFIIMGPFSVIAALIGVFSCMPDQSSGREPELLTK